MRIPLYSIPIKCIPGIAASLLFAAFLEGCTRNESAEISSSQLILQDQEWLKRDVVKIAAGQVNQDENKYEVMLTYIDSAGAEGADLIVLPEYIAGVFSIPL